MNQLDRKAFYINAVRLSCSLRIANCSLVRGKAVKVIRWSSGIVNRHAPEWLIAKRCPRVNEGRRQARSKMASAYAMKVGSVCGEPGQMSCRLCC